MCTLSGEEYARLQAKIAKISDVAGLPNGAILALLRSEVERSNAQRGLARLIRMEEEDEGIREGAKGWHALRLHIKSEKPPVEVREENLVAHHVPRPAFGTAAMRENMYFG